MTELTPAKREELQESFDYNDPNGDGRIDYTEFVGLLEALNADIPDEQSRLGFGEIDSDRDGAIGFEEFVAWWVRA